MPGRLLDALCFATPTPRLIGCHRRCNWLLAALSDCVFTVSLAPIDCRPTLSTLTQKMGRDKKNVSSPRVGGALLPRRLNGIPRYAIVIHFCVVLTMLNANVAEFSALLRDRRLPWRRALMKRRLRCREMSGAHFERVSRSRRRDNVLS